MKRVYILEDLDCANCAAKIEEGVKKMEGVEKATLSFMSKKLVIEAEDDKMEAIEKAAKKLVKKLEPDVEMILKK